MKSKIVIICMIMLVALSAIACSNNSESTNNSESQISENVTSNYRTISSDSQNKNNILIAYFSLVDIVPEGADASTYATPKIGNTEAAALEIQSQTGGDLFAIKTAQKYPVSHSECSAVAEKEMRSDARPELSSHIENMEDYDIIFVGFPIWWYQEPMAIRTFLQEYDFSGKTIIPFCTTFGAGVEESQKNIKTLCPQAEVLKGLTLHTGTKSFTASVEKWLKELGIQ